MLNKRKKKATMEEKMNVLRAGVLGSNDGILTVVGVLFSVGAATSNRFTILIAGLADLVACALSMSAGEYASVSDQRDTEKSAVEEEATNLKNNYSEQINIVKQYYQNKGVSLQTANLIAKQLMEKEDRVATLVNIKHGINMGQYLNPWMAAWSSMFSAALGGLFPLVAMTYAPSNSRWLATILAVIISVGLTGMISAKLGKSNIKYAVLRNIVVGIITMAIHYYVGQLI